MKINDRVVYRGNRSQCGVVTALEVFPLPPGHLGPPPPMAVVQWDDGTAVRTAVGNLLPEVSLRDQYENYLSDRRAYGFSTLDHTYAGWLRRQLADPIYHQHEPAVRAQLAAELELADPLPSTPAN